MDETDLAIFADHYGSAECAGWLGQIIGTIQCPDGGPFAGAMVYVPGDSFVSITDEFGRFKLRALPDGLYPIAARLAGEEIGREEDVCRWNPTPPPSCRSTRQSAKRSAMV